jgi:Concanavalin A-like lectin/glucanases superfamily
MRTILCVGSVLLWCSFSGYSRGDLKDGLVGYWNFDETSGSIAHSLVPLSDDGALFNFPCDDSQWVPGQIGGALHFRGPDFQDYVIASFYPLATTAVSFSGWVNADVNTVRWQSIFKNWGGAHHGQFHFGLDNTSMTLGLYIAEAADIQIGPVEDLSFYPNNFPTGQWVHVGFVIDGSSAALKVYLNGQLAGFGSYDGTLLNPPRMTSLGIGLKTDDTGTMADAGNPGYWQGSFDDFGLWTRALSDDEMAQIYALGQNGQSFYGQ